MAASAVAVVQAATESVSRADLAVEEATAELVVRNQATAGAAVLGGMAAALP